MEGLANHKSLERGVSQRAIQMGNSYSCQIYVVGFLCGICLTTLFMAALTSSSSSSFAGSISSSAFSSTFHPNSKLIDAFTVGDSNVRPEKVVEKMVFAHTSSFGLALDKRLNSLYSIWSASLNSSIKNEGTERSNVPKAPHLKNEGTAPIDNKRSNVPKAPHLENCKLSDRLNQCLDKRIGNEKFPRWTIWKGSLDNYPVETTDEQSRYQSVPEGAYPPWISGSDEENYPLTRKVQRDIWAHQHPVNCSDPSVRFLVADWERVPGFGIGAQVAGMCGLLAIAIREKRVLVTNYYNRADHDGCKGSSRSSWSCYFFPETSQECRDRAFDLMKDKEAWRNGIITGKDNYKSKEIWTGRIPRVWGEPWSYLQPTTEINGTLISRHRKMDRRWWRAQAVRYLMRFKSEYMCGLLNIARHEAFGWEAAKLVLSTQGTESLEDVIQKPDSGIEEYVWSNHKPWLPRPLLSMHVRMGDKACEMKVVQFEEYMRLANRIRQQFPHLNSIWLSTEMQEVIDKTRSYPQWKFYYSIVTRQVGNMQMANYEASLGRETSTNYPLVNFLMAVEADFFIGALGSTWCFLIDGMRNTGGKVMAGYISVNKDRFW